MIYHQISIEGSLEISFCNRERPTHWWNMDLYHNSEIDEKKDLNSIKEKELLTPAVTNTEKLKMNGLKKKTKVQIK